MNACTDALCTVFKGHVLAFACKELGIENIDSDLNNPTLTYLSDTEKRKFIVGLSMKVVNNCTIIGDAIMGKKVKESGDKKYDYAQSLCHYAPLTHKLMMSGVRVMGYALQDAGDFFSYTFTNLVEPSNL